MKEKTFEELIRERIDKGDAFTPTGIIEMMKQVREATIAECTDILLNRDYSWSGQIELEYKKLPTNSIKTDL